MLRGNQLLNMDTLHKTRVANNRVCTCWKEHKAEMTNLAFKCLDMTELRIVNTMKNWIINGDSCPGAGDQLYDLLWVAINNLEVNVNKYFAFKSIKDNKWLDVVLLRSVYGYPPYTVFDKAEFDMENLRIIFTNYHLEIVVRASINLYMVE